MTHNTEQWVFLGGHLGVHGEGGAPHFAATFAMNDAPGWAFLVEIGPTGEVQRFNVAPAEGADAPPTGITTRLLRQLPLGAWANHAKQQLSTTTARRNELHPLPQGLLDAVAGFTARPGRRGRSDVEYARVAAAYVERLQDTTDRTPVESLAASLHLSPSQVRSVLYEARSARRGLLTKSPPGRPGGTLTDKARQLLKEASDGEH